jgi:protein-disulfide isomerase
MKNKLLIISSTLIFLLIVFFVGRHFFILQEKAKADFLATENAAVFVRDYAMIIGNMDAKVNLTEFMDPECESCRALYPEVKDLIKKFEGKVRLVIRYAPFHGNSKTVVKILEATRLQNKYVESLEVLFSKQPEWGDHHQPRPELIWNFLSTVEGLDVEKVRMDMNSAQIEKIINQDIIDGEKLQVRQTPTFFVNGKPLQKFSIEGLEALIKNEINLQY